MLCVSLHADSFQIDPFYACLYCPRVTSYFFLFHTGCHIPVSTKCCGLVQGGCGDSSGKEIQQRVVRRFVGVKWRSTQ